MVDFSLLMGMILIGVFALAFFNILDARALMDKAHMTMFILVLLIVGALDMVAGVILAYG